METTIQTDVLIIGGGGAGMRAAIAADLAGARVLLLSKGPLSRTGLTPQAATAFQAAFHQEDSPDQHFGDICDNGHRLADQNLARVLADEAPARVRDLIGWGVRFKQEGDRLFLAAHPGQRWPRSLATEGGGYAMAVRLKQELQRHPGVRVLEDYAVTRLLTVGGEVVGAVALDHRSGQLATIQAKSVILATGGYQRLWGKTDAAPDSTGDGTVLGMMAGARLIDLELMLFYPTCYYFTEGAQGLAVGYEWYLNEKYLGAKLVNVRGEEFLPGRMLLRDELSLLIFQEIAAGRGSERGGVFIDVSRSPKDQAEKEKVFRELIAQQGKNLMHHGLDATKELVEVAPGAHFSLGGIHINERCETTVPGLFAAGEIAGNAHGANRLVGNALAEGQVFGERAGRYAAHWARLRPNNAGLPAAQVEEAVDRIEALRSSRRGPRPAEVRRRLEAVMDRHAGPTRSEAGLAQAAELIRSLQGECKDGLSVSGPERYNQELRDALQVQSMLTVAAAVVACARLRTESRGHHLRLDFPQPAAEWQRHIAVHWAPGGLAVTETPVVGFD